MVTNIFKVLSWHSKIPWTRSSPPPPNIRDAVTCLMLVIPPYLVLRNERTVVIRMRISDQNSKCYTENQLYETQIHVTLSEMSWCLCVHILLLQCTVIIHKFQFNELASLVTQQASRNWECICYSWKNILKLLAWWLWNIRCSFWFIHGWILLNVIAGQKKCGVTVIDAQTIILVNKTFYCIITIHKILLEGEWLNNNNTQFHIT